MLGTLTHVTATWVKVPSKADVNDLKWTVGPIENFQKTTSDIFLPYLALILCWSIDGVACISIFYYMEMLDHAISHVWLQHGLSIHYTIVSQQLLNQIYNG